IRNTSEPLINFRMVGGQAHVERNVLATGPAAGSNPDALRIVGSGTYWIAHNSIDCGWQNGAAAGLHICGQSAALSQANGVVVDNDVMMSAPDGTTFASTNSAGIEFGGFGRGNGALNNRIRGRARAAVAVA